MNVNKVPLLGKCWFSIVAFLWLHSSRGLRCTIAMAKIVTKMPQCEQRSRESVLVDGFGPAVDHSR